MVVVERAVITANIMDFNEQGEQRWFDIAYLCIVTLDFLDGLSSKY